jgi:hypothetical protein
MFNVINPLFLDRQFIIFAADRLPVPLGEFISEEVYLGKLRSCHKIVDHSCVAFIDVSKGEEMKEGNSYKVSVPTGLTDYPVVDIVGKEHGGGAHGRSNRQTVSST